MSVASVSKKSHKSHKSSKKSARRGKKAARSSKRAKRARAIRKMLKNYKKGSAKYLFVKAFLKSHKGSLKALKKRALKKWAAKCKRVAFRNCKKGKPCKNVALVSCKGAKGYGKRGRGKKYRACKLKKAGKKC